MSKTEAIKTSRAFDTNPCIKPFEAVSIDLGYLEGIHYLILADWYSGWSMVKRLTKLNTKSITTILDDWYIDMGKPVRFRSDGGPQFRSEFEHWVKKHNITHELSSPYHHQCNGQAEVTVKEMKHLLTKTERNLQKFLLALREYRNTPRFDGLSLSQWLTGYRQRTDAPAAPSAYERITDEQLKSHLKRRGKEQARIKN